jgi:hypothetical protein
MSDKMVDAGVMKENKSESNWKPIEISSCLPLILCLLFPLAMVVRPYVCVCDLEQP